MDEAAALDGGRGSEITEIKEARGGRPDPALELRPFRQQPQ
jgi:hypothetical protein